MTKKNQMNKSLDNKSASMAFVFYAIALLIYSIYSVSTTGELGIPFIILMAGLVIYFSSLLIFRKK